MGTEEYSDFDSDSGEEWLNDMRGEDQTEDTATSTNDAEKIRECGKLNICLTLAFKLSVNSNYMACY